MSGFEIFGDQERSHISDVTSTGVLMRYDRFMKKCNLIILIGLFFFGIKPPIMGQNTHKPTLDFSWGYNRSFYTQSNIRFKDEHYNFTLYKVKATDRPTNMTWQNYLNPERLTIPQYNARITYTNPKLWSYSLSVDHMKYVMIQDQEVRINGTVADPSQNIHDNYSNSNIILDNSFLTYEHTDGLNYINFSVLHSWKLYKHKYFNIDIGGGSGIGALIPRTNARFLNGIGRDEFHLSGLGLDLNAHLKLIFKNRIVVTPQIKTGFIHMPDVRISDSPNNKIRQSFGFVQWNMTFGYRLYL